MIARILKTNETVNGELWAPDTFIADDGREWPGNEVEIIET